jgi:hypothetical protein
VIEGANYFNIHDIAKALNVNVKYDAKTRICTITIPETN